MANEKDDDGVAVLRRCDQCDACTAGTVTHCKRCGEARPELDVFGRPTGRRRTSDVPAPVAPLESKAETILAEVRALKQPT